MNLSPNLETVIADNSISSVPMSKGKAGYILGSQWGAINKPLNILSKGILRTMFGKPTYNISNISNMVVQRYLDYNVGGAVVVRAGKDDSTTINSVKFFSADMTVAQNWNNGTAQKRKLNAEDDSYESIQTVKLVLATNPTTWSVGDTVTGATSTATGVVESICVIDGNATSSAIVYVKDVVGTFRGDSGVDENVTDGTTACSCTDTTINTIYGTQFVEMTFVATDVDKIGVGMTLVQGANSAVVVGKVGTLVSLTDVSGAFVTATALTSFDGVAYTDTGAEDFPTSSTIEVGADTVQALMVFGKYAGTEGNDIDVSICNRNDFNNATGTSTFAFADEFEVTTLIEDEIAVVIRKAGTVVEAHICSLDATATSQGGKPKFIDDYLEMYSDYIGSESKTTGTHEIEDWDDLAEASGTIASTTLVGGACGVVGLQQAKDAYDVLLKKNTGVSLCGDFHELENMSNYGALISYLDVKIASLDRVRLICTLQKDSINVNDIKASIADIISIQNSYIYPYYEWTYVTDGELKKKYYVPLTGDHIALTFQTWQTVGDWYAPAGTQNGILRNVTKMYHNLDEGDGSPVSDLYKYGINADVFREDAVGNTGYYAWGNRSKFNAMSDLSRQNVVNAMITDVMKLGALIQPYIFQPIDDATFNSITQVCDAGYLSSRSQNAFYQGDDDGGYRFVCDRSNNDAQSNSEKTINVLFMVKYKASAEYIKLKVVITASGINFELV